MTDHTLQKRFIRAGSLLAALGVLAGAFGAHGLKDQLTLNDLQAFETGVRYQFIHASGILLMAALIPVLNRKAARNAYAFFLAGIVLFSGSLYLLATRDLWAGDGLTWIGAITPFGGLSFIAGWLVLFFKGYPQNKEE